MQIVTAATELLDDHALHRRCERLGMSDRDDRVAISPQHRDWWKLGELVGALKEGAALAAPIDHVAHRSGERARRAALGIQRAELRDVLLRHGARAAERAPRSERHERLAEEFD